MCEVVPKMISVSRILIVYLVVGAGSLMVVSALDFRTVDDRSCSSSPRVDTNIDGAWLRSVANWYLAGGSKYHLYWITLQLYDNREDLLRGISEEKFYSNACFKPVMDMTSPALSNVASMSGYEPGRTRYFNVTKVSPGVLDFSVINSPTTTTGPSRHYITLTDNRSFIFFTNCLMGNQKKTWDVISSAPLLSPDAIRMIEEHAVSQGFDRRNFVWLRNDLCSGGSRGVDLRSSSNIQSQGQKSEFQRNHQPRSGTGWSGWGSHG